MDRQTWTDADQAWAHREAYAERVGWFEVLRPARYREHVPTQQPARTPGKHVAPDPADEEPSPAANTARTRTLRLLIIAGAVIVGLLAVRSLMGAS